MRIRKILMAAIGLLAIAAPIAAWAFIKPLRVIAPELMGLHCGTHGVCVDDRTLMAEAVALRDEAIKFVNANVGRIESPPRAIFCSTSQCAKDFGFTNQFAFNVGQVGMALSPRGWKPFFVRHELIHHLQNERLGTLNAWWFKPSWLLEGMAYLSSPACL